MARHLDAEGAACKSLNMVHLHHSPFVAANTAIVAQASLTVLQVSACACRLICRSGVTLSVIQVLRLAAGRFMSTATRHILAV